MERKTRSKRERIEDRLARIEEALSLKRTYRHVFTMFSPSDVHMAQRRKWLREELERKGVAVRDNEFTNSFTFEAELPFVLRKGDRFKTGSCICAAVVENMDARLDEPGTVDVKVFKYE